MFHFGPRARASEPAEPASQPNSPTRLFHVFNQHPSGSRFTEDEVSAVLSSETGSDATSLSALSFASWKNLRTQPSKLQKVRRATEPPRSPVPIDEGLVGDGGSDITSITWVSVRWARPPIILREQH